MFSLRTLYLPFYHKGLIDGVLSAAECSLVPDQGPSCQPTLEDSWCFQVSLTFQFTVLLGTLKALDMVLYLCPDLCLTTKY